DRNRSHWSTSKTPSYTKSVSWQHHRLWLINPTKTLITATFLLLVAKHGLTPNAAIFCQIQVFTRNKT
ncbi:hypothetical protein, partial [Escherichia coli]|nr:hypothetical protein [Escherichia coli]